MIYYSFIGILILIGISCVIVPFLKEENDKINMYVEEERFDSDEEELRNESSEIRDYDFLGDRNE